MAFTFDPTTDRGKVRLLLHDTTSGTYGTNYTFSDADIDALLETNGDDVWLAAADGCRTMAAKLIASSMSLNIAGSISINKSQQASYWMSLATKYDQRSAGVVAGGGTLGGPVEYIDSYAAGVDEYGRDSSEYVGDD